MMTLRIVPSASQLAGSFMPMMPVAVSANTTSLNKVLKLSPTKVTTPSGVQPYSPVFGVQHDMTSLTSSVSRANNVGARNFVAAAVSSSPSILSSPILGADAPITGKSLENKISPTDLIMKSEGMVQNNIVTSTSPKRTTNQCSDVASSNVKNSSSTQFSLSSNISSLLDLSSTANQSERAHNSLGNSDKLLDLTLNNSGSAFMDMPPPNTTSSPTNSPFKGGLLNLDNTWLEVETEDLSLSSLLGHLESPLKHGGSSSLTIGLTDIAPSDTISRLSTDVDNQLQCMMNESSVDYIAKFADLAAQIAIGETPKKSAT